MKTGSVATSWAQCCPGLKRTELETLPIVIIKGQSLTFPDVVRCVLSDVKMIGMMVTESAEPILLRTCPSIRIYEYVRQF